MYETLTDRAVIEISGDDSLNFLHNLTTNNIKIHDYCYNYVLNNLGKYLFDLFILKLSEKKFLVDINRNQTDLFKAHLNKYKLRAKVEITDSSDIYQVLYSKKKLDFSSLIMSIKDPRYTKLGVRSIIKQGSPNYLSSQYPKEISGLYLQDKYEFTIVDGYEDLIYERSIPIEYGGEELNAISYTKGCYLGQEVISRTKHRGVIRKKIFKLFADINISNILKNDDIIVNNTKIGVLCSYYKNTGIALVRVEDYEQFKNNIFTIRNIPIFLSVPEWLLLKNH